MSGSASIASLKDKRRAAPEDSAPSQDRLRRLEMRAAREHAARHEAERLLESKSLELFELNRQLAALNAELEQRVKVRTAELEQQRQIAERLVAMDHLTKVASRTQFAEHLQACLMHACADESRLGLLLVDIDEFKQINDSLGHLCGDDLLIGVAQRLHRVSRGNEMVARLGGDEFAVLFPFRRKEDALGIASRFAGVFQEPLPASGLSIKCKASIGVAIYPDDATTVDELQRFADLALYQVKSTQCGGLAFFEGVPASRL